MTKRILPAVNALCLFVAGMATVHGEPYFSAWKGVSCNACHVNQTAGYARNSFGKNFGESLSTFDWDGIGDTLKAVTQPSDHSLSISGDLHFLYTQNMDSPDPGNLTNGRQEIYLACNLNKALTGVFTYRPSGAREVYGLVMGLPANGYIKFGMFQLPFGLMLADDQSYVRTPLGFSFERSDTGVEAGMYPDPFFLKAAVLTNYDTPADPGKIFSAYGGLTFNEFTVGGSFYREPNGPSLNDTERFGGFGWLRLLNMVGLVEYDWGYKPSFMYLSDRSIALHCSVEMDLGQSFYLRLTREFLNPSYAVDDESFRDIIGINFFPVQNLQVLAQYQLIELVPDGYENFFSLDVHQFF